MPIVVIQKSSQLIIDNLDEIIKDATKDITSDMIAKQMEAIECVLERRVAEVARVLEKDICDERITI